MPYTGNPNAPATGQSYVPSASQAKGMNTNSIMQGWVDRCPWQYYDTITLLAGAQMAQQYSPFSVAIGQQDPLTNLTKNELQTNMRRGNQFPPPNCLLLNRIGFYFESTWLKADIDLVLQNYIMKFYIDEKYFHTGYFWLYPAGGAVTGVSTRTSESSWQNGIGAPGYMRTYGPWSKYIAPEQQFGMTLQWFQSQVITSGIGTASTAPPTLTNGGTLRIYLDGFTDRSVQ